MELKVIEQLHRSIRRNNMVCNIKQIQRKEHSHNRQPYNDSKKQLEFIPAYRYI